MSKYKPPMQASYDERRLFAKKLELLGLQSTGEAAKALGVTRFAVMHWKAGRRKIPKPIDIIVGKLMQQKFWDFMA